MVVWEQQQEQVFESERELKQRAGQRSEPKWAIARPRAISKQPIERAIDKSRATKQATSKQPIERVIGKPRAIGWAISKQPIERAIGKPRAIGTAGEQGWQ
jgi:hypothetical protein